VSGYFKTMSDGSPVNKQKARAIQLALGLLGDGKIGAHTFDGLYRHHAKPEHCYSDKFFNNYVITGKAECVNISTNFKLLPNHISGTFSWKGRPSSALVFAGKILNASSSHAWLGKPDTVLYFDGIEVRAERSLSFNKKCEWAIGGVGLHNWNPVLEGYGTFENKEKDIVLGDYSDVFRETFHTAIGVYEDGYVCMVYFYGTGQKLRDYMMKKLKFKLAVMLDGGHYAAIRSNVKNENLGQYQNCQIGFGC